LANGEECCGHRPQRAPSTSDERQIGVPVADPQHIRSVGDEIGRAGYCDNGTVGVSEMKSGVQRAFCAVDGVHTSPAGSKPGQGHDL
jgi:hypothetical protein